MIPYSANWEKKIPVHTHKASEPKKRLVIYLLFQCTPFDNLFVKIKKIIFDKIETPENNISEI